MGDALTHSANDIDLNYELRAYTACGIRTAWKNDPTRRAKEIVEVVDDLVDCMTCLIRLARRPDPIAFAFTNPCGEIELPEVVSSAPCSLRDGPSEPGFLQAFRESDPDRR